MSHSHCVCTYFPWNKSKALFVTQITSSISRSCHPLDHMWLRCRSTLNKVRVIVKAFLNCIITLKVTCLICKCFDIFPSKSIKEILETFYYHTAVFLFPGSFDGIDFNTSPSLISPSWGGSLHHTWESVLFTSFFSFLAKHTKGHYWGCVKANTCLYFTGSTTTFTELMMFHAPLEWYPRSSMIAGALYILVARCGDGKLSECHSVGCQLTPWHHQQNYSCPLLHYCIDR